jgi:hypothetical protein
MAFCPEHGREEECMENRGFPRLRLASKAALRTRNDSVFGTIDNISMSGVFVRAKADLEVGDRSEISVQLPNVSSRSTVIVDGIVVRVEEEGVAYRFQNIHFETFGLLRAILQNKSLLSQVA